MADFNLPGLTSNYATVVLQELKGRDVHAITLCLSDPTNIPTGAIKWNRAGSKFQEYISAAWEDKLLSIAGGGTGSSSASSARTALGLGSMATQNNNTVDIDGGDIASAVTISAASLSSGTVAQSRLGSGSGGAGSKFLADDQTFKVVDTVPVGSIIVYGGFFAPPVGWLDCNGAAVSRTTYSALFAALTTAFGSGDGSTTFNLPDLRGRFPLGQAVSGVASNFGSTGGNFDHVHTGPSHSHGFSSGTNVPTSFELVDNKLDGASISVGRFDHTHNFSGTTDLAGIGNTGTANPPYQVIRFLIKY